MLCALSRSSFCTCFREWVTQGWWLRVVEGVGDTVEGVGGTGVVVEGVTYRFRGALAARDVVLRELRRWWDCEMSAVETTQ